MLGNEVGCVSVVKMFTSSSAYITSRILSVSLSPQDVICASNGWTLQRWLGGWESQQASLTSPPSPPPHIHRSMGARKEVAGATLTSLWRLYLRLSAWDLTRATYININKACCWGPPVRGCQHRGQRRDASALTSRLIALSLCIPPKSGDYCTVRNCFWVLVAPAWWLNSLFSSQTLLLIFLSVIPTVRESRKHENPHDRSSFEFGGTCGDKWPLHHWLTVCSHLHLLFLLNIVDILGKTWTL